MSNLYGFYIDLDGYYCVDIFYGDVAVHIKFTEESFKEFLKKGMSLVE